MLHVAYHQVIDNWVLFNCLGGQTNTSEGASAGRCSSNWIATNLIQVAIDTPHPAKIVKQTVDEWLAIK